MGIQVQLVVDCIGCKRGTVLTLPTNEAHELIMQGKATIADAWDFA